MPKKNTKKSSHRSPHPLIAVIMGSQSDWVIMEHGIALLEKFEIGYQAQVVSAHRTPHRLYQFSQQAEEKGYKVIIAAAGGAAHLPGMVAALTTVPVLGVPIPSEHLQGLDSLLSIVQMPQGVPVGTLAIGKAGAINAAWLAMQILATDNSKLRQRIIKSRQDMADRVMQGTLPSPAVRR